MPNESSPSIHKRQESLPKLTLPLGHEIILSVSYIGAEQEQSIKGRFVGAEDYAFVAGLFPTLVLSITSFFPKTPISVSYFHEGSKYQFYSEVICHANSPGPILYFTYPDRVTITGLRKAKRVECSIPCSIFCQQGEANAMIFDLSSKGCRIVVPLMGNAGFRELDVDEDLVLNCSFSTNKTLITPGTVKSVSAKGPFITFGIEFSEVNTFTEEAENFIRLLTSIKNYNRQSSLN